MKDETSQVHLLYADNCSRPISLQKRRFREDVIGVYEYLIEGSEEDGVRFFSVIASDRTRNNEHKLKYRKFHFHWKKNLFTVRVVKHCSRASKQIVDSLSLETLCLWVLGNPLELAILKATSCPNHSIIPCRCGRALAWHISQGRYPLQCGCMWSSDTCNCSRLYYLSLFLHVGIPVESPKNWKCDDEWVLSLQRKPLPSFSRPHKITN